MKILVPYRDVGRRSSDSPVVSGGIERFIRHLHDELGAEVFNITLKYDSDPLGMACEVAEMAKKADLIICNYPNPYLNTNLQTMTSVPILWVCHHTAGLSPTAEDTAKRMAKFKGDLWMVSERQMLDWNEFAKTQLPVKGIIPPSFVMRSVPHSGIFSYDIVTVGRCDPMKNPFLAHELGREFNLKSLVMSSHINNKYAAANINWDNGQTTKWSLPDKDVSFFLSRCRTFYVTWPDETFGIAALEALAHGLPLILEVKEKGKHACLGLIPGSQWIVEGADRFNLEKMASINMNQRRELSEIAFDLHGIEAWRWKAKEMTEGAVK